VPFGRSGAASGSVGLARNSAVRRSAPLDAARTAHPLDPVVTGGGALGQNRACLLRAHDRQRCRSGFPARTIVTALGRVLEEPGQVGLDGKPWLQRIDRGSGDDIGRVDEAFLAPDHSRRHALLDDHLEEAPEDRQPGPVANAGAAGVVGERLGQTEA
jgi:hypothetical protein